MQKSLKLTIFKISQSKIYSLKMYSIAHLSGLCLNDEIPVDWLTTDAEPHYQQKKELSNLHIVSW